MIKCKENKAVEIRGDLPTVLTELTLVLKGFREALEVCLSKELANELVDDAVRLSRSSDEDLKEEVTEVILKTILWGGEDSPGSVEGE